jgi:hypothetical protein
MILGPWRNTHDRQNAHWGSYGASLVSIDPLAGATTLQAALELLDRDLTLLETSPIVLRWITLDAVIRKTMGRSFTLDAELAPAWLGPSFTLDAVIFKTQAGSFTLDSVLRVPRTGEFSLDAMIRILHGSTFTLDAELAPSSNSELNNFELNSVELGG